LTREITGVPAGGAIVKVTGVEVPPPGAGFITVMERVLGDA
jgi:hypothetical protein